MADWDYIDGSSSWQQKAPNYNNDGTVSFVHNYAVKGALATGSGWSAPLAVGDRFFVPYVGSVDIVGGDDSRFWGVYEIVVQGEGIGPDGGGQGHPPGWHPTPGQRAIIKRADYASTSGGLSGLVVGITGDPLATNYGKFYHITNTPPFWVDNTAVTLELLNSYTRIEKYEALTGPQLISEGASSAYIDQSVTGVGGGSSTFAETALPLNFDTLVGTPGVTSLAVGTYTFDVEAAAQNSGGSPGSVVILRAKLIDLDGGGGVILTADSPPVTASGSRPEALRFSIALTSPYAFATPRRLRVKYYLWTNSNTSVLLGMRYNTPSRGTKITLPFAMGVSGASDGVHGHLSGRSDPNQHPATSVSTDITNFNHNLSSADTTVQHALDTLDNLVIPTPPTVPTRYPGPMTPVGADDAGTPASNQWADGKHSHPVNPAPPPPSLASSTLYTAKVGDPHLRIPPCKCHLAFASGFGWNATQWTSIYGLFTWRQNAVGPILGYVGGGGTTPLLAGDRVYIAYDAATSGGPSAYLGIYEVLDPGSSTTQAIIRRSLDANTPAGLCHSMTVEVFIISGPSDWPVIVTADPIVVDTTLITLTSSPTWSTPPTLTDKWELLTGPQITSEGALTTYLDQSVSGTGLGVGVGFNATALPLVFDTLVGTPGVDTLAAGPYVFDVEAAAVTPTADPGALVILRAKLYDADTGSMILVADSPPVTAVGSRPEALHFVGVLSSPYTWTPGHKLRLKYDLWTDSATPVLLGMTYNSSARGTKLTVPFIIPVSGASDGVHNHLSGRDKDVASTDTTINDPCHPWSALGPKGRIHTKIGTGDGTAGLLVMPADASECTLSLPTTQLLGIGKTGFLEGDRIIVHLTNPTVSSSKELIHNSSVGSSYSPLWLPGIFSGGVMVAVSPLLFKGPAILEFLFRSNLWWLINYRIYP
jgi:hypothetical protein